MSTVADKTLPTRDPERFDLNGNMPDEERLQRAMDVFANEVNRTTATYLESCMHCGICAEACHYYIQTEDPKYTPVWKLEASEAR